MVKRIPSQYQKPANQPREPCLCHLHPHTFIFWYDERRPTGTFDAHNRPLSPPPLTRPLTRQRHAASWARARWPKTKARTTTWAGIQAPVRPFHVWEQRPPPSQPARLTGCVGVTSNGERRNRELPNQHKYGVLRRENRPEGGGSVTLTWTQGGTPGALHHHLEITPIATCFADRFMTRTRAATT